MGLLEQGDGGCRIHSNSLSGSASPQKAERPAHTQCYHARASDHQHSSISEAAFVQLMSNRVARAITTGVGASAWACLRRAMEAAGVGARAASATRAATEGLGGLGGGGAFAAESSLAPALHMRATSVS